MTVYLPCATEVDAAAEPPTAECRGTEAILLVGDGEPVLAAMAGILHPDSKVPFTSGRKENRTVHHGRLGPGVQLRRKPCRRTGPVRMVRAALDRSAS